MRGNVGKALLIYAISENIVVETVVHFGMLFIL
jgi:hypothetical protein